MASLAERVATRFLQADAIGDPKELVQPFASLVDRLAVHRTEAETALPFLRRLPDNLLSSLSFSDRLRVRESVPGLAEALKVAHEAFGALTYLIPKFAYPGSQLFLSIIQTYALPASLRKKIEMASRTYMKTTRLRWPNAEGLSGEIARIEAYLKYLALYESHLNYAKEAIAKGKGHTEEGAEATKVRVGSFTLVNTGGFSAEVMGNVAEAMKKAEALLKSSGFGIVCYGDVQVTNTISKGNVLAFYLPSKDELFIRANLKPTSDSIHIILHELGHRFEAKKLSSRAGDLRRLYSLINGQEYTRKKEMRAKKPPIGDKLVDKGKTYEVAGYDVGRNGLMVVLKQEGDPRIQAKVSLEGYLSRKGEGGARNVDETPDFKGFVTEYAKKTPSENFAEMFAYYCMGRLPVLQSVAFEELCFGSSDPPGESIFTARRVVARWIIQM